MTWLEAGGVECYAGYRYPERPRAFVWEGERVEIEAVERRWRTPAGPTFRIRTTADTISRFTPHVSRITNHATRLTFHTLWYNTS